MLLQYTTGHMAHNRLSFFCHLPHVLSPNFPGIASSTTLPRLYDHPLPSRPSGCLSFFILFMIKWAAHGDVADVPLRGLNSLHPLLPPPTFPSPPNTRYDTTPRLGNGFPSISLLIQISTAFSFPNCLNLYTTFFLFSSHVLHISLSLLESSYHIHILRYSAALAVCLSPPS